MYDVGARCVVELLRHPPLAFGRETTGQKNEVFACAIDENNQSR